HDRRKQVVRGIVDNTGSRCRLVADGGARQRCKGLQGTRRYTNASTRLTVKFRVEKVRTCSVQTPTRSAWPIWASSRNATQPCRAEASLLLQSGAGCRLSLGSQN